MIASRPAWTFTSAHGLGNIRFLGDKVVGTWACLERESGRLIWEKRFDRPNTIIGIGAGIILASETLSLGATLVLGCYGISLDTGELLWAHGSGWRGALLRRLDSVPGFANDLRDAPITVIEDKVLCSSGRILRLRDGATISTDKEAALRYAETVPAEKAWRLYSGETVPIDDAGTNLLSARPPGDTVEARWGRAVAGDLVLYGLDNSRKVRWRFSSSALGWHVTGNYYSYRLSGGFVYLIACDGPSTVPIDSDHPSIGKLVSRNYRFAAVDATTGEVCQDFPLGNGELEQFHICAVSPDGLLLRLRGKEFAYHPFA